jgi:hypothetical protein
MRTHLIAIAVTLLVVASSARSSAQAASSQDVAVPRLITVTGVFQPVDGQPPRAVEAVTLSIYADAVGGAPLWQETQTVSVEANGRYALLLGATRADGIPADVLAAGAEWLGLRFDRPGEREGPRARLTSVPYALRSADADTLGGRPASAYLLAPTTSGSGTGTGTHAAGTTGTTTSSSTLQPPPATPNDVLPGTANFVAKYVDSVNVGAGTLFDTGSFVGLGTTTPQDFFHVRFTNPSGAFTGLAVQNMGNTATSYSGMLFYDHLGNLGQFQGFNNITHEYRINNIASSGSINFMLAGSSRFNVTSSGNIGIGTTAPVSALEVSNAVAFNSSSEITATALAASLGASFFGRRARGTIAAPSAVQAGDTLALFAGKGYGATGFGPSLTGTGGMAVQATQNWTDTSQATSLAFSTTPLGAAFPAVRMTLDPNGNLGLGTTNPTSNLEVVSVPTTAPAAIVATTYRADQSNSIFQGRKARGTQAAPAAVQANDILTGFSAEGYGATGFGIGPRGGMFVAAAENWTDAAQGTTTTFMTTPLGASAGQIRMTIDSSGNVGIGTQAPSAPLEVSRTGTNAAVASTLYANGANVGSFLVAQTARGTAAAPTAVQAGDLLGAVLINGYGTTRFQEAAVVGAVAAENFTDAARGTAIGLGATPIGGNDSVIGLALLPSGNVSIGTPADANGIPTAADKLQVYGDIRVGAGANGCVKNFAGTQIAGTCASDRRFKKNITPFGSVLSQLTALQPVHYYWRATEFPDRHFGDAQTYGLVAQEVEQVLPELVVTNVDGYKAVDYSKLPLLTIQAVKELKAENDALKSQGAELKAQGAQLKTENDDLRSRVEILERLIREMHSTAATPR